MSTSTLDVAVSLYDHGATETVALAQAAEELGFSGVWLGEHVVVPLAPSNAHPYRPTDDPPIVGPRSRLMDMWGVIGAIAASTQRLMIGTGVYLLPLRPPVLTALAAVTAQELSGGRLQLGVGSGWLAEEYEAVGVPFDERGSRLDEYIDVLRAATAGGPFEHKGSHVRLAPMQITARHVPVPVIIGGVSRRALRRAAVRGDGWYNPSTTSLEDCCTMRNTIEQLRRDAGNDGRPFTYHIRIAGLPDRDTLERYHERGFTRLTVSGLELWPRSQQLTLEAKLERLEQLSAALDLRSG